MRMQLFLGESVRLSFSSIWDKTRPTNPVTTYITRLSTLLFLRLYTYLYFRISRSVSLPPMASNEIKNNDRLLPVRVSSTRTC